jgi:PAS domain S-box-containing protein
MTESEHTQPSEAEKKLHDSEERFQAIINSIGDNIFTMDTNLRHTGVYGAWVSRLGMKPEDFIGKTGREIFGDANADLHENATRRALNGEYVTYEWEGKTASGDVKYFQSSNSPIRDENGRISSIVSVGRDITEIKNYQNELALRAQLLDSADDGICLINEEGHFIYFNNAYCRIHGYSKEELAGMTIRDLDSPEDQRLYDWLDHELRQYGYARFDSTHLTKDGRTIELEVSSQIIESNGKHLLMSIERDITERKRTNEELALRAQLLDSAGDGICLLRGDRSFAYVNEMYCRQHGYTREELLGMKIDNIELSISEERRIRVGNQLDAQGFAVFEAVHRRKDGSRLDLEIFLRSVESGGVTYNLGVERDITERKKSQKALMESEEKYRGLVNNLSLGIFRSTVDPNGRFLEVNPAMETITGYTRNELLTMDILRLYHNPDDRRTMLEEMATRNVPLTREVTFRKKDGGLITVRDTKAPMRDENGKLLYLDGIIEDITMVKALEEERQKINKLESVGILAGGIAHDFNNLLTGIMGNISMAMEATEKGSDLHEWLLEADKASERARNLTQQLLTFSKGGAPVKQATNLANLIQENTNFVIRGTGIRSEYRFPDNLWMVEADGGQISQVITNLVINARDAMPEGGTITVSAANIHIDEKSGIPLTRGNYVEVQISDSGTGIQEKFFNKIFDPYFTTKQKGSGLGLATVYSIITNHNGIISVDSQLGIGTTFTFYLPASSLPAAKAQSKPAIEPDKVSGGRILIMDDEDTIRLLLNRMLTGYGYEVTTTSDGKEALTAYRQAMDKNEPFEAVILDITVPGGMGGIETIEELMKLNPGIKAVVSSGYATDPVMSEYRKYGFKAVINKPYKATTMRDVLDELLGNSSQAQ